MADESLSETKICTKCGEAKPRTAEFYIRRRKGSRDGLGSWCRECALANSQKLRECHEVQEKERLQSRLYRKTDRYRKALRARRERKGIIVLPLVHLSAAERRKKEKERKHIWKMNNPDRVRAWQRRANAKRRGTPEGKINGRISARIWECLSAGKGGGHWEEMVGYSLGVLMTHLERQFSRGMNWSNIGRWHVDHIIPLSHFRFESASDVEFRRAWSLTNLRPIWAENNIRKHAQRTLLL